MPAASTGKATHQEGRPADEAVRGAPPGQQDRDDDTDADDLRDRADAGPDAAEGGEHHEHGPDDQVHDPERDVQR